MTTATDTLSPDAEALLRRLTRSGIRTFTLQGLRQQYPRTPRTLWGAVSELVAHGHIHEERFITRATLYHLRGS